MKTSQVFNALLCLGVTLLGLLPFSYAASGDDPQAATDVGFTDMFQGLMQVVRTNDADKFFETWDSLDADIKKKIATNAWNKVTLLMATAESIANPLVRLKGSKNIDRTEIAEQLCEISEINAQDNAGRTALHNAIGVGNFSIAKVLLECGADPNLRDSMSYPPTLAIVTAGYVSLYELAIEKGADLHATINHKTALSFAIFGYDHFFADKAGSSHLEEQPDHLKIIKDLKSRGFRRLDTESKILTYQAEMTVQALDQRFLPIETFESGDVDPHMIYLEMDPALPDLRNTKEELREMAMELCFNEGFEESQCKESAWGGDPLIYGLEPFTIEGPTRSQISIRGRSAQRQGFVLSNDYNLTYTLFVEQEDDLVSEKTLP